MDAAALPEALAACQGPTIVCAQAGNVNTGAVDPLPAICAAAHEHGAWVHVDGAFGLWAAASPALRHLVAGVEQADSLATDAHKWLNVPYDSGLVFVAHPEAHRAAFATAAGYLTPGQAGERDPDAYTAEFSRRARGFPVWAALRSLGRSGVAAMVERGCAQARRFAAALEAADGVEVLNEVVLNQVLVRFRDPGGDHDGRTREVVRRVQAGGTLLAERHHLARHGGHAHLGVELVDHRRRRRPFGGGDPGGGPLGRVGSGRHRRPAADRKGCGMADDLLGVYLNDHLAGSAAGTELAEKLRDNNQGTELGNLMAALHNDIEQDRASLEELMARLEDRAPAGQGGGRLDAGDSSPGCGSTRP